MTVSLKRWTQLGLGAALATGTLAACGSPEQTVPETETEIANVEPAPAMDGEGEGVGGEGEGPGGEGEGGVSIARAATDPIVYGAALAITKAHVIAARDAYALGETSAASEMFGHPVSEVLFEMQPVFEARGVESFNNLMIEASELAFNNASPEQVDAKADEILAALRVAAEKAPDSDLSAAAIAAGIAVDQIERAADMYRVALESEAYGPYLDGYGFYKAGEAAFLASEGDIAEEDPASAAALMAALAELAIAYPSAVRPESLDADVPSLTAAASNAVLAVNN